MAKKKVSLGTAKNSALFFLFLIGCVGLGYFGSQKYGGKIAGYVGLGLLTTGGIMQLQQMHEKKEEEKQARLAARISHEQ
jgi:hypothetical protein